MQSRATILALLFLACCHRQATAANPQAAFSVENGWVQVRLLRDDKPIPSARIRVYDLSEHPFAEGETDDQGAGSFPAPRRQPFFLGITIDGKECDLITLRVHGKTRAEPGRVLLSFGTRPCCRAVSKPDVKTDEFSDDDPEPSGLARTLIPAGVGLGCILLAGLTLVLLRSNPSPRS